MAYPQREVIDISCGQGRDIPMLAGCGFKRVVATEITQEIVDQMRLNLEAFGNSPADALAYRGRDASPVASLAK